MGAVADIFTSPEYKSLAPEDQTRVMEHAFKKLTGSSSMALQPHEVEQVKQHFQGRVAEIESKLAADRQAVQQANTVRDLAARNAITSAVPIQQPQQTNFAGDLANHAVNAALGYTQDDRIRQSGNGVGATIGDLLGGIVPIGAGALAGGLAGSAVPVVGNVAGAIGGGIVGAGAAGTAQDLQAQRIEGKPVDLGRALGSGAINAAAQAIPGVGQGGKLITRLAKNIALQGGAAGLGAIGQQALEQKTLTPNVDWNRVGANAAIGGAGGILAAHAAKVAVKHPEIAKKIEAGTPLTPQETASVHAQLSPEEVSSFNEAWRQRTVGEPGPIQTGLYTEQQAVKDLLKSPKVEQVGDSGLVVAREGAAKPPVDLARATERNAVGQVVEPAAKPLETQTLLDPTTGQPFKEQTKYLRNAQDIAIERASRPDLATAEPVARTSELPPQNRVVNLLDAQGRERGARPDTAPTNLLDTQTRSDAPANLLDATGKPLPPRDLAEIVNPSKPNQTQVDPSAPKQGSFIDTINELAKDSGLDYNGLKQLKADLENRKALADGVFKGSKTPEAQRIRSEHKQFKEQWKAVDPNIKSLLESDINPETGMGAQRPVDAGTQLTLEQIQPELSAEVAPLAARYAEAMQKGLKIRHKYIGEQVGRSNESAKLSKGGRAVVQTTEFSPTHFGHFNATFADGPRKVPAVFGYNQRGHEVGYYLMPSPKGSRVQQVLGLTNKPSFKGQIPNVYQGSGQFNAADILARGQRTERGFIKTSEAIRAIHETKKAIRAVAENTMMTAEGKQALTRALDGRELSFDDVQKLKQSLGSPERLAQFCQNMGLQ